MESTSLSPQPDGTGCEEDRANELVSGIYKNVEEPRVGSAILGLRWTPARYRAVPGM